MPEKPHNGRRDKVIDTERLSSLKYYVLEKAGNIFIIFSAFILWVTSLC